MNPYRHFIGEIETALKAMQVAGELPAPLDFSAITAEPPRDSTHGDIATNIALRLAKPLGMPPPKIGQEIAAAKGAPEAIIGLCRLDERAATAVRERVDRLAASGLRVLAVATPIRIRGCARSSLTPRR